MRVKIEVVPGDEIKIPLSYSLTFALAGREIFDWTLCFSLTNEEEVQDAIIHLPSKERGKSICLSVC